MSGSSATSDIDLPATTLQMCQQPVDLVAGVVFQLSTQTGSWVSLLFEVLTPAAKPSWRHRRRAKGRYRGRRGVYRPMSNCENDAISGRPVMISM